MVDSPLTSVLPAGRAAGARAPHSRAPGGQSARSGELPGLGDADLWVVLLATLLLQLLVWTRIDGYALADSVEYLEHAQALVRGERVLDSSDIRGTGFALLLAPPFLLAEALGLADPRWIVPFARTLQVLAALLLVRAAARIGALLAGRRAGLAGGLIAGTSPVLLLYSVEPVADVLATLLVAMGLLYALEPGGRRRGFAVGLWLGAALLIAFKSVLAAGLVASFVLLRDIRRRPRVVLAMLLGLGIGVAVQLGLDRWRYGEWGRSLGFYLGSNALLVTSRLAGELGFIEVGRKLYELGASVHLGTPVDATHAVPENLRQREPRTFYLRHATSFLSWPALVLLSLGVLRALARPRWARSLPLFVLGLAAVAMSFKGAKDFRLWLPLLPAVAGLVALGFGWLARDAGTSGSAGSRSGALGVLAASSLVLVSVALSAAQVAGGGNQRHAGYWRAMELVNADAREQGQGLRVTAAWHWAVFLREAGDVELVKLPHHLEGWERYDEAQRAASLAQLDSVDRLITHVAVLAQRPELLAEISARFAVDAALFDPRRYRDLGPVLVLTRRVGAPGERLLLELLEDADPFGDQGAQLAGARDFLRPRPEGGHERLRLLGFEVEPLRGGHWWLSLRWMAVTPMDEDLSFLVGIEGRPGEAPAEHLLAPAWGAQETSSWEQGWIVRQGYPLVTAPRAFDPAAPWKPLGEGLEQPSMKAALWLAVLAESGALAPARSGAAEPLGELDPADEDLLDGRGGVRVGEFELLLDRDAHRP